jgi:hypothetical protein
MLDRGSAVPTSSCFLIIARTPLATRIEGLI